MDILANLTLAAGLGLLGFIEPCTVGSTAVLFRTAADFRARERLSFAGTYVLLRTVLTGLLGVVAVVLGGLFVGFQTAMWIGLGALYIAIGAAYIAGYASRLGLPFGRATASKARKSAVLLGGIFSLNIPACAAPLLALLVGSAATAAPNLTAGFLLLAVFGLAISLPVAAGLLLPALQRPILSLSRWSDRVPTVTGILLAAIGAWSILLALVTGTP